MSRIKAAQIHQTDSGRRGVARSIDGRAQGFLYIFTAMAEETKPAEETKAAAPFVFGSATGGGAGTGFSGFASAATSGGFGAFGAAAAAESGDSGAGDGGAAGKDPEAECQAEFKPLVELEKVEEKSGEEGETVLLELKSKLYRYDFEHQEWKERGLGFVKVLEHNEKKIQRILMRRDKTLKICANHLIMPGTELQEHAGNDKAWVWSTPDFAEEEMKNELFCIRFGTVEKAQDFKKAFEAAAKANEGLLTEPTEEKEGGDEADKAKAEDGENGADAKESGADALADDLAKTKVEGEEAKEEPKAEEAAA